ncbi:hypothetical protein [Plantactinospora sp. BB1]|uniref:hypothetical protein n=1 Tax=Plantactinospora sp. BB1 TaxID=2071627 RepID=UPI000D155FCC|nr:hypothetical protein [Plantactinospora sp. BB1]AVT36215.1 hypothetical protein C6W10_06760 [Plantactinospora sp. BB1]
MRLWSKPVGPSVSTLSVPNRTLADLRELIVVAWLAQNASHDPKAMNELTKRLTTLCKGTGHREWRPF